LRACAHSLYIRLSMLRSRWRQEAACTATSIALEVGSWNLEPYPRFGDLCCGLRCRSAEQASAGEPAECATRFASSSPAARTPGREPFVRDAKWGPITGEIALADLITSP
jgi:hypothetical protein